MTSNQLKQIFTTASDADIAAFLTVFHAEAKNYNIITPFQENAFLAQVLTEVGSDLKSVRENMNYSCSSLKLTFSYFKRNPNEARKYGRCDGHSANQAAIANRAYANRIGNGDVDSGDGDHFRGGGFFQLTGRGNYARIGESFPQPITADALADKITTVEYGLLSAMAFWDLNNCDKCSDIDSVTRIINKHTDSYAKRKGHYQSIAKITA